MEKKLKIAQIILPWIPLPPKGYGGTERIVYALTEELVKRGHAVTLFASGDSQTSAHLDYLFPKSFGLQENVKLTLTTNFNPLRHVAYAFSKSGEFEVIHSHAQYLGLPFAALVKPPTVHTFHRIYQGSEDEVGLLRQFKEQNFVSISNSQRELDLNFIATVYNGIFLKEYEFGEKSGDYLLWVGRIMAKKGVLEAIGVAKKTGMRLKLAGVVTDPDFFKKEINPHIDGQLIEYLGELTQREMASLYKGARATLFPVLWQEPFGLVMIESMACGTPVVAFNRGAIPEVVVNGLTGFVVENDSQMIEAVKKIGQIDRAKCRRHVEKNFTVEKMTDGYEKVYQKIIQQ